MPSNEPIANEPTTDSEMLNREHPETTDYDLHRFNDKYDEDDEDEMEEDRLIARNARRHRLLRRRIREAKIKALLPQPWNLGNPGPLGLLGFGMSTVMLNMANTGHWPVNTAIIAMAITYGGGMQLIAGMLEFCKGNTFGSCAFMSFGGYWFGLAAVFMLPTDGTGGPPDVQSTGNYTMGIFLFMWGIFSFFMMICALRMSVATFLGFFTATWLLMMLGAANMAGNQNAVKFAGYEGMVTGSIVTYVAYAEVVNEMWDRTILPVLPTDDVLEWFALHYGWRSVRANDQATEGDLAAAAADQERGLQIEADKDNGTDTGDELQQQQQQQQ